MGTLTGPTLLDPKRTSGANPANECGGRVPEAGVSERRQEVEGEAPTNALGPPCASADASPANERGKPKLESERGVKRRKATKNGAFAGDRDADQRS